MLGHAADEIVIPYTAADALGLYLTGAASDGGAQVATSACLGNFRSSSEVRALAGVIEDPLREVIIERILPGVGEGDAVIRGDTSGNLYLTPAGTSEGTAVAIADGETKLIEGPARDQAIRVRRDGDESLFGSMTIGLVEQLNAAIAGPNLSNAERIAGADKYRAIMLRAHGANPVISIVVWIGTLGTQQVTDVGQLGGSGTGTIQTSGSLADWPDVGFCQVRQASGTLREIVYYSSRTADTLTISAAGHRGLLGTSPAAGAATDTIDAVPGIRIAVEAPDGAGKIQTIADEDTAPAAVSWSTAITQASGLSVGTLDAGKNYGIWLHREFPASGEKAIEMRNVLALAYYGADA